VGSSGTVALADVWAMLEHCAPGYWKKSTDHHWRIGFDERLYPSLPLGAHGTRKNPEIQIGHVRKMARFLGILECAKQQLPQLA